jgi:hypothetical protein
MNRVRVLLAIDALALSAIPGAALACDIPGRPGDPEAVARHARDVVEQSVAIIDAEVVTPTFGNGPAELRPLRVLRGPALPLFRVVTRNNCDFAFLRPGQRVRIVLTGGPGLFHATPQSNGGDFSDRAGPRRFLAALDALLGVPRPRGVTAPWEEPPSQ